jgi:hypothetical protein
MVKTAPVFPYIQTYPIPENCSKYCTSSANDAVSIWDTAPKDWTTANNNEVGETWVQTVAVLFKAPSCCLPAGNEEWLLGRDSNQAPPFNSANRLRHLALLLRISTHLHEIHITCYTPTVSTTRRFWKNAGSGPASYEITLAPLIITVHRSGQQPLARAMDDFKRRIENCIQEDGRRLNDIIFHTWIPNSNGMSWPLIL